MKHSGTLGVYVLVPLLMETTMGAPKDPEPLNPRTLIMKILKLAEPWFLLPYDRLWYSQSGSEYPDVQEFEPGLGLKLRVKGLRVIKLYSPKLSR